jgi:MAP/microtubule affinity-regulating kinase
LSIEICQVAIKAVKYKKIQDVKDREQLEREKKIVSQLDHPNIVKLIELIEVPDKNTSYMIFEYVSGGDLFQYLQNTGCLDETEARRLFRQVEFPKHIPFVCFFSSMV